MFCLDDLPHMLSFQNVNKENEEDSKKVDMDVALALKQSVESSSEA